MAATTGSFVDTMQGSLREILPEAAYVQTMIEDPIYKGLVISNAGMMPPSQIGRDLEFHKRYFGGGTGVIRGGNMNDFESLYGGQLTRIRADGTSDRGLSSDDLVSGNLALQALTAAAPDPLEGATLDDYGISFFLYSLEGNIALALEEYETEALPAATREYTAPKILGLAKRLALFMATSFYANSANSNALGTFPATVASADILSASRMIVLRPTEMVTYRFMRGQELDIWPSTFPGSGNRMNQADGSSANTSNAKRVKAFVHDVNDLENTVTIWLASASNDASTFTFGTNFTTGNLAGAYVTAANTYGGTSPAFKNLFGWRHFLKWGGSAAADYRILGSEAVISSKFKFIDIRDHAEHASFHKSIDGQLTIRRLARILEGVSRGMRRNGDSIDCLIGCPGLWLNMSEQDDAKEDIDITGKPSSLQGRGVNTGGRLTFDGKSYDKETSEYLEDGYCLGLKRSGNFQMAVPPSAAGVKKGGILPNIEKIPIEWLVPALTGGSSARFPILTSSGTTAGLTSFSQMPFKVRCQLVPRTQIRGLVLDGCTTSREFSEV